MDHGYSTPLTTSRAALRELERQLLRRSVRAREGEGADPGAEVPAERKDERKENTGSKGAGRKHGVQPRPEDQRGRPDPKQGE